MHEACQAATSCNVKLRLNTTLDLIISVKYLTIFFAIINYSNNSAADFNSNELATLLSQIISQSINEFAATNNAMMIKLDLKNDYNLISRKRRGTTNELSFTADIEHEFTALRDLVDKDDFVAQIEDEMENKIREDIDQQTNHLAHLEMTNSISDKQVKG